MVNATAYTAVDRAEDEPELAFRANAEAPTELAAACAVRGAALVHYSTDYVFDGSGTAPYREDDPTAPLGVYGASKLAGEQGIHASGARHLILRTAWVYGLHGRNFLRTMLRVGAERDELRVVADQRGCPTPAWLIADVDRRGPAQGHPANPASVTWSPAARPAGTVSPRRSSTKRMQRGLIATPSARDRRSRRPTTRRARAAGLFGARYRPPARRVRHCHLPDWRKALAT